MTKTTYNASIMISERLGVHLSRRDLLRVFGAMGSTGFLGACDTQRELDAATATRKQQAILEKRGISGEHELVDLQRIPGFFASGQVAGSIVLFSGSFEGQTTTLVQFAWRTSEEAPRLVISEVPINRVVFLERDVAKPAVSFEFTILSYEARRPPYLVEMMGISGAHRYTDSDNPNDYVNRARLVNLRLASADFQKFVK